MNFHIKFIYLLILLCTIGISCTPTEDGPANIDITGDFEGRIVVPNVGQGNVLYSFEKISDNSYRGFYEGTEFGEITVNVNQLTGVPSSGNTAFASLIGEINDDRIAFNGFDANGNLTFYFGGNLLTTQSPKETDLVVNGDNYRIIDSYCAYGGIYGENYELERNGGIGPKAFLNMYFKDTPTSGTYEATTDQAVFLSGVNMQADFNLQGDPNDEASSGSVTVSVQGGIISTVIDNLNFNSTTLEGTIGCTD